MALTEFLWDPLSDNVIGAYQQNGDKVVLYTNEPELYGNVIDQHSADSGRSVYHADGLGSTFALTNQLQSVTDTFSYTAYGVNTERSGATQNCAQYVGARGYYTDPEMQTIYVRERHYLASTTRWLCPDPASVAQHYRYVANSPVALLDPSGNIPIPPSNDFEVPVLIPGGEHGFYQEVVLPPTVLDNCGRARAEVKWKIDLKGAKKATPGWIIQRVTRIHRDMDCEGHPITKPRIVCYYEAWEVGEDGKVYVGFKKNAIIHQRDRFHHPNIGKNTCSAGDMQIGNAMFVPGYKLTSPPWILAGQPGYVPEAGTLPVLDCTGFPPDGWSESETIARWLRTKWNCCCDPWLTTDVSGSGGFVKEGDYGVQP